MYNLMSLII